MFVFMGTTLRRHVQTLRVFARAPVLTWNR
jgi:hypothetical protein